MEPIDPGLLPCGFRYEVLKTITEADVRLWAGLAGEQYPSYGNSVLAQRAAVGRSSVPDTYMIVLIGATIARLAGHLLPPGATVLTLAIQFIAPVAIGATLAVVVTVAEWDAVARVYRLDVRATHADGTLALAGSAGLRPHTTLLAAA